MSFIEIALSGGSSIVVYHVVRRIYTKVFGHKPTPTTLDNVASKANDDLNAGPYRTMSKIDVNGIQHSLAGPTLLNFVGRKLFTCLKCASEQSPDTSLSKYCACHKRDLAHFHYKCTICGFTAMMKTADEK